MKSSNVMPRPMEGSPAPLVLTPDMGKKIVSVIENLWHEEQTMEHRALYLGKMPKRGGGEGLANIFGSLLKILYF